MEAFTIKRSDIDRCPKRSMAPSHYWRDGQCRCDSRIGVVAVRDPDGGLVLQVFVDGQERQVFDRVVVDAGRGYDWSDWQEGRDWDLRFAGQVSQPFQAAVAAAYDDPPGGEYVTGRGEQEPWLPLDWSSWE